MAPLLEIEHQQMQSFLALMGATVFSAVTVCSLILLLVICGCGGKKKPDGAEGQPKSDEPAAPQDAGPTSKGASGRQSPVAMGIAGGDKNYRTLMAVDKDFLPSAKEKPSAKKVGGPSYIEMDTGSKRDNKPKFASSKDPAYKSLIGIDEKFEASAKKA